MLVLPQGTAGTGIQCDQLQGCRDTASLKLVLSQPKEWWPLASQLGVTEVNGTQQARMMSTGDVLADGSRHGVNSHAGYSYLASSAAAALSSDQEIK